MRTKRRFDGSHLWACECGLLNWWADRQCRQCHGARATRWSEFDRRRHVIVHVYDSRTHECYDEAWYVPDDYYVRADVRQLVHQWR